MSVKEAHI